MDDRFVRPGPWKKRCSLVASWIMYFGTHNGLHMIRKHRLCAGSVFNWSWRRASALADDLLFDRDRWKRPGKGVLS